MNCKASFSLSAVKISKSQPTSKISATKRVDGFGADRTRQTLQSVTSQIPSQQPRSFYRPGSRVAVPTPNPVAPAPTIWVNQSLCAPGPTYILKLGPLGTDRVPVQSGATV